MLAEKDTAFEDSKISLLLLHMSKLVFAVERNGLFTILEDALETQNRNFYSVLETHELYIMRINANC